VSDEFKMADEKQAKIAELEKALAEANQRCDNLTKGTVTCSECRDHDSQALAKLRQSLSEATRLLERANMALGYAMVVGERDQLLSDIQDWLRIARVPS